MTRATLVLTRRDVVRLLDVGACIDAVERAFRLHAAGGTIASGVLGTHVGGTGFHVKTAGLAGDRAVFVVAVAWLVYERALAAGVGMAVDLGAA
jgi:ornithine cyclodeaminase/alanine dehydrogenase-like protein (mu-crystallin family)